MRVWVMDRSNKKRSNPLEFAIARRDAEIMKTVRRAIDQHQVLLAYQPIVRADGQDRAVFHEALLRLLDETGRIIPAIDFIKSIEDSELGRKMDCIALEKGLDEMAAYPDLRLAINMSARTIGYGKWMQILTSRLAKDPTIGERLILEITEHSTLEIPEKVVDFMDDLQCEGISFAIDDFGSGYTSIRHFRDYNFDILKIDESFVKNVATDTRNQVLVRAMVAIAKEFDVFTVAEGVEQAEDAEMLAQIGVNCLQGYYFAAPTVSPLWRPIGAQIRA